MTHDEIGETIKEYIKKYNIITSGSILHIHMEEEFSSDWKNLVKYTK